MGQGDVNAADVVRVSMLYIGHHLQKDAQRELKEMGQEDVDAAYMLELFCHVKVQEGAHPFQNLTEEQKRNKVTNSRATQLDNALAAWAKSFKDFQKLHKMPR